MNQEKSEMTSTEPNNQIVTELHPVNQITPVSRYLALLLFVLLPFIGGYVGYRLAPERVVVINVSSPSTVDNVNINSQESSVSELGESTTLSPVQSDSSFTDEEITTFECISEANPYPHNCFRYTSKISAQEILNLTEEAKKQGVIQDRAALADVVYIASNSRIIYFTAGIPDSSACCKLLSFNKDTLKFDSVESYLGLGVSFASKDNRYIATVESDNSMYILDLEEEKIIMREQVTNSLMSSKCGYAGPVYDVVYNKAKNGFDYGIYGQNTVSTDECQQEKIGVGFLPIE